MANKKPAKKVLSKKALRKTKGGASLSISSNSRPSVSSGEPLPMEQLSMNYAKIQY